MLELTNMKGLLGNIPYFSRSPNEDWTSPTGNFALWSGVKRVSYPGEDWISHSIFAMDC